MRVNNIVPKHFSVMIWLFIFLTKLLRRTYLPDKLDISLERIETSLGEIFLRINESCIVNKGYVEAFNKKTLIIGAEELPVSKSHVKELYSSFHIL